MEWSDNLDLYPAYLRSRIKQGRGLGIGSRYIPWLGLREGRRKGTTGLPLGIKTGRRHDLRSAVHRAYFFLQERRSSVGDVREQFPILDIEEALGLCAVHDVEHPYAGLTPEPILVDFVLTLRVDGEDVFEARDLIGGEREQALLPVKRAWCDKRKVHWSAVDTTGLTQTVLDSLIFIRGWHRHRYEADPATVDAFVKAFARVCRRHLTLEEVLEKTAVKLGHGFDHCANHVRYAAWSHRLAVDVREPIAMNSPVVLLEP